MGNITISVDDSLLSAAKAYAKKHNTSLNGLLRQLLERTVQPASGAWLEEFFAIADVAGGDSTGRAWTRDELHER